MKTALLIPCHNAAAYLPRLWQTVRAQTRPFDAVFCYDDASEDNTAAVAEALGAQVIRSETNRGPAHARNALLHACQAEWIHFHDADDLLTRNVRALTRAVVADLVGQHRQRFGDERVVERRVVERRVESATR